MKEHDSDNLSDFLKRTGNLLIHLLDKCNLHCNHCYLNARRDGCKILPLELVKRTLDEADEMGLKIVQFSGGELFLHPDVDDILKSTLKKNFKVIVSTNGTLITEEYANLLAKINARIVTSIDGPEEYHDVFRGQKGSFLKTANSIARLVNLGVPVDVVTTVCEDSLEYIDWCAEWAYNMKVEVIQFQPLENIGRGEGIKNKKLQTEKLHDLFIHLKDLSVFYAKKGLKIKMTYQSREFMLQHPCTAFVCNGKNCHRGVEKELKKIVIREDGLILPELVDIDRRFAIGNLFDDTLRNNLESYLENGYQKFDRMCREVYNDSVVNGSGPLISWNEILTERSRTFDLSS